MKRILTQDDLDSANLRMNGFDTKFQELPDIKQRLTLVEATEAAIDLRLGNVEIALNPLNTRITAIESKGYDSQIAGLNTSLSGKASSSSVSTLAGRVTTTENQVVSLTAWRANKSPPITKIPNTMISNPGVTISIPVVGNVAVGTKATVDAIIAKDSAQDTVINSILDVLGMREITQAVA